jgi:heme-degrading monooxygenase HmoA
MMTLRIRLRVLEGQGQALQDLYRDAYVPAIRVQPGFLRCELWQQHGDAERYEIAIYFQSEDLRLRWVASPEHTATWPRVEALCAEITWQGFESVAVPTIAGAPQA